VPTDAEKRTAELSPLLADDDDAWVKSGVDQSPLVADGGQGVEGGGGDGVVLPCRVKKGWGKKTVKRGPRVVLFWPTGREKEAWPVSRGTTWREGVGEGSARGRHSDRMVGMTPGGAVGGGIVCSRRRRAGEQERAAGRA
jgi:hypothetical protein